MGNVLTVDELKAEGIDNPRTEEFIRFAESYLENVTGFRFYKHSATFNIDGTGNDHLVLPQAIISITTVKIDTTLIDSDSYVVRNRRPPDFDDRFNPHLVRIPSSTSFDLSGSLIYNNVWAIGRQNIEVVGVFGFTDLLGSAEVTPPEIKRVAARLVALETFRIGVNSEQAARLVRLFGKDITASDLRVTLSDLAHSDGPSGDRFVDMTLSRYRHPTKARVNPLAFGGA